MFLSDFKKKIKSKGVHPVIKTCIFNPKLDHKSLLCTKVSRFQLVSGRVGGGSLEKDVVSSKATGMRLQKLPRSTFFLMHTFLF